MKEFIAVILGAGPAGLTVGLELVKHDVKEIVIIDKNHISGGLSRTELFQGNRFDIGPHRVFFLLTQAEKFIYSIFVDKEE